MIRLGEMVSDRVTGVIGVATGRTEYLHGVSSVQVQPVGWQDTGAPLVPTWFDEGRLQVVSERVEGGL